MSGKYRGKQTEPYVQHQGQQVRTTFRDEGYKGKLAEHEGGDASSLLSPSFVRKAVQAIHAAAAGEE